MEDSYKSLLKAENLKLKKKIEELENSLMRITQSIQVFASGIPKSKTKLVDLIENMISSTKEGLYVVTPKVGNYFTNKLIEQAKKGISIQIIINDRRFLASDQGTNPKDKKDKKDKKHKRGENQNEAVDYAKNYDLLKVSHNIDLINNPNVKFLMIMNKNQAIFSGGWLEKDLLEKTVLLGTLIKDPKKLNDLKNIYSELLPSFMR
ncbi:MAG: hypothetical protein ACTSO2_09385 [Promethearchaeota archaeon]